MSVAQQPQLTLARRSEKLVFQFPNGLGQTGIANMERVHG